MTKAQSCGLTAQGFKAKDFSTIKNELEADLRKEVDPSLHFGPGSVAGMITAIVTNQIKQVWEVAYGLYHSLQPSSACGRALDELCSLTGTYRRLAAHSRAKATASLGPGVTLTKGSRIETSGGHSFVTTAEIKNRSSHQSEREIDLVAEKPGPIMAHHGSIAKIMTPVAGWSKVVIKHTYEIGRLDETDDELRLRRILELKATGSSTLTTIHASIRKVDQVEAVHIKEGIRNFEAIVKDGKDDDIALAIWLSKPIGIETVGAVSRTIIDSMGQSRIIRFSRPDIVPMTMSLSIKTKRQFEQGELDGIKNVLANFAQKHFSLGKEIYPSHFYNVILSQPNVLDVINLRMEHLSGRFSSEIAPHQIASLRYADITVQQTVEAA